MAALLLANTFDVGVWIDVQVSRFRTGDLYVFGNRVLHYGGTKNCFTGLHRSGVGDFYVDHADTGV